MKSYEEYIESKSDYYVYTPSVAAQQLFFYPLQCGHFFYEPGYSLCRDSFDSFLFMYIEKGSMVLEYSGQKCLAYSGQFLFLDCYQPHSYHSPNGCECFWCHFDGVMARAYYDHITARFGTVFSLANPQPALGKLKSIYDTFRMAKPVKEPLISKYITDLFTAFLLGLPMDKDPFSHASISEEAVAYINEHFARDISVESLAKRADLSQYHFIRVFKEETGFTPHQYLVNTRIAAARYLLKNSNLSAKDICFHTGFSCESVFCSAFKKHQGVTQTQYRDSE